MYNTIIADFNNPSTTFCYIITIYIRFLPDLSCQYLFCFCNCCADTCRILTACLCHVRSSAATAADIAAGVPLLELLAVRTKVFPSKGEARKMTQQGAVSINKAKVTDPQAVIGADSLLQGKYILVQRGKKNQFLIKTKQ